MNKKIPAILIAASIITACGNTQTSQQAKTTEESSKVEESAKPEETDKKDNTATIDETEVATTDENESEVSETKDKDTYTPGTYTAYGQGMDGDVEVIVEFDNDSITNITIGDNNETSGICEKPFELIPEAIIENQSLAVDSVSGATVTSSAIKTAVSNAVNEAGGDVDALRSREVPNNPVDEEFTYDVVVAGGGLSGIVSAYEAASNGAKVALIEKNGLLGGTSITASGNMLVAFNEEDKAKMKQGWLDRSKSQDLNPIDMDMLDALIDVSPNVMELYEDAGVDYRTEVNEKNGSITAKVNPNEASKKNAENITIPSKDANAKGGPALIFTLVDKLEELGVDIYLNTPATELIKNDGKIEGVISQTENEGVKTFNASSVVLATGDYAHNKEMDQKYNKRGSGEYSASAIGNTGDGHILALEAGAIMNPFQESMSGAFNANPYDMPMIGDPTNAYPFESILLNMEGKRVFKEDGGSHPQKFEFVREDGLNTAWAVMDSEIAKNFVRLEEYLEKTEEGDKLIKVYKADSIKELAKLMELDPDVVQSEVNRYNELAALGEDKDYEKDPKFLKEFNDGPYYAALLYDGTRGVYGGIKTNTEGAVVDKDNNPIPGLYASGVISSGQFFGDFYPGRQALAVASHMGYISGKAASEYALDANR